MKEIEEFTRGELNHKAPFPGHSLEGMTYNIYIYPSLSYTHSHTHSYTHSHKYTHIHTYISYNLYMNNGNCMDLSQLVCGSVATFSPKTWF